jgi:hypothetical protein
MASAARSSDFIDDACEGDDESEGSFGESVEDIEKGVRTLLSRAEHAISRHSSGEDAADELLFLSATAIPNMRDDVRALEHPPPIHREWLDALSACRSSVRASLGGEDCSDNSEESSEDGGPVGPQLYRSPAVGVEADMATLLDTAKLVMVKVQRLKCECARVPCPYPAWWCWLTVSE